MWTRMAFGRFWGGINAVLYWISNPIWIGGILTLTRDHGVLRSRSRHLEPSSFGWYAFGLIFIWFATARGDPLVRHRQVDSDASGRSRGWS